MVPQAAAQSLRGSRIADIRRTDIRRSENYFSSRDGFRAFYYRVYPAPLKGIDSSDRRGCTIIVQHGFNDCARPLLPLANYLASLGHTVYLPELIGHGRSEGTRGYIHRFSSYSSLLADFMKTGLNDDDASQPIALIASSSAGLVVIEAIEAVGQSMEPLCAVFAGFGSSWAPGAGKKRFFASRLISLVKPRFRFPTLFQPDPTSLADAWEYSFTFITASLLTQYENAFRKVKTLTAALRLPVLVVGSSDQWPFGSAQEFYSLLRSPIRDIFVTEGQHTTLLAPGKTGEDTSSPQFVTIGEFIGKRLERTRPVENR